MPERLAATALQLSESLDSLTGELRKVERRSHIARVLGGIGILVGIIGLIVGAIGIKNTHDTRTIVDSNVRARVEGRIAGCVQYNQQVQLERVAIGDSIVALVPPGTTLTPDQEATVARYRARVNELLPFRDCSEKGIETYFSLPPSDPAVTGGQLPGASTTAATTPPAGPSGG